MRVAANFGFKRYYGAVCVCCLATVSVLSVAESNAKPVSARGYGPTEWPQALRMADFILSLQNIGGAIPDGVLRTVVPAAPDAWITALEEFGTMSFADCASAAIRFASGRTILPRKSARFSSRGLHIFRIGPDICGSRLGHLKQSRSKRRRWTCRTHGRQ